MGKIITFANSKGGVGKSTLTEITATTLSQKPFNKKVAVIDLDTQKSLVDARKIDIEDYTGAIPFDILNWNPATLKKNIEKLDSENDFILLDFPGKLDKSKEVQTILQLIDFCFVPVTPGNFAIDSTVNFLLFLKKYNQSERKGDPVAVNVLITKCDPNRNSSKLLLSEMESITLQMGTGLLSNQMKAYTLYEGADTVKSIYSENSKRNDATNWRNLFNEIFKIIE